MPFSSLGDGSVDLSLFRNSCTLVNITLHASCLYSLLLLQVCSGAGFCDCGKCNCNVTSLGVPKLEVLADGAACDCTISDEQCKDGEFLDTIQ